MSYQGSFDRRLDSLHLSGAVCSSLWKGMFRTPTLHRLAPLGVALVALVALSGCASKDPAAQASPSSSTTSSLAGGEPVEVIRDASGRLVIPTTTVPVLGFPIRVSKDLELAGVDAQGVELPGTDRCTLAFTMQTRQIGFAFDSAEIPEEGRQALALVAAELAGGTPVRVVGHSSSEGDADYNVDLSKRRAAAVVAVLQPDLPSTSFEPDGVGAAEPVAPNETEEGRVQNRRVVISVDVPRDVCDARAAG